MRCSPLVRINRSGSGSSDGEQVAGDARLVDAVQRQLAGRDLGRDRARRGDDFRAPAIGQRDRQVHPVVVAGQGLGVADHRRDIGGEPIAFADDPQPHAVAVQFGDLAAQIMPQQPHQRLDLILWPLPVLRREAEQRQIGNPEFARRDQTSGAPRRRPADGRQSRGRPRACAQRPLPSMMIATCRGRRGGGAAERLIRSEGSLCPSGSASRRSA